jgi:hypothetical protein
MKRLEPETLLGVLRLYESAIRGLKALNDPAVHALLERMQRHRAEVVAAFAAQGSSAA